MHAAAINPPCASPLDTPRPFDLVLAEWNSHEPPRPPLTPPLWLALREIHDRASIADAPPVREVDPAPRRRPPAVAAPVRSSDPAPARPSPARDPAPGRTIDPPVRPGRLIDLWA